MYYALSIATVAGINIICVAGLIILTGFTGMFSMGHAGFMAVGGYSAAVLYMNLHVPFLLAVLLGGVFAALSSMIVGIPTMHNRLTGDCFAIAMLGFGEAIRLLSSNIYPVINGAMGLVGIPKKTTFEVVVVFVVVILFFVRNYMKSQYGKNLVAVQQQEIAAEMMGIDVTKTKLWSLALSAFFTGVGGGLFAFYMTCLYPSNFTSAKSTDLTAAVVFGGTNSITGPVIAAALLIIFPEVLRVFSQWRFVIYGVLFVGIMLFKPEGLLGYKEFSIKGVVKWCRQVPKIIGKKRGKAGETPRKNGGEKDG